MKLNKILSTVLAILLSAAMLAFPVSAAEKPSPKENNAQIQSFAAGLEKKYGITITYPIREDGYAAITMNNLETLDLAFMNLTPSVVMQVSKYYQERNGSEIDIRYVMSNKSYDFHGGVLMAAFERSTSRIYVFIPSVAGHAIVSGENPIALVHEFGHAFHLMCADYYGNNTMLTEWTKFNNGIRYDKNITFENPDKYTFISGYSASSFEEDFAEVFAHTFVRHNAGAGFRNQLSQNGQITGLGKKVDYIEKMLPRYLTDTADAVANYRRIYDTPTSMTFEGIKFSGEYLQYIGYPQPRNVLKGMINGLQIEPEKSTWSRKLGAWRVIDNFGDMYFVFPGGAWASMESGKIVQ